jgi:hypothetical protein
MNNDKIAESLGLRTLEETRDESKEQKSSGNVEEQVGADWKDDREESERSRNDTSSRDDVSELGQSGTSREVATNQEINPPAIIDDGAEENLADLEEVRQNIKGVMETGDEALKEMLEIAKQSESARAFEVVSTLMKTMLDANKDLADISTKKRFVKEELAGPKQAAQTNVTNNNLIVSTADLLKMIKGEN